MDKRTGEFVETAREYLRLIDNHAEMSKDDFYLRCVRLLPILYAKATLLPEPDADLLSEDEKGLEVERPCGTLTAYLGEDNTYLEVFDPFPPLKKDDVLYGSLADDLASVYGDVKEGLILWDEGRRNEALWEWRFGFRHHWGDHLVDGMRPLHRLAFPE